MRAVVLCVSDLVAKPGPQFGKFQGNGGIHNRMPNRVRSIMRQRAQGEGQFIDVMRVAQQLGNKVSAANVVNEITEELVAKRIVAHVLDEASAISIGVSFAQVLCRGLRIAL